MTEEFWNSDGVNGCLMKYKPWIMTYKRLYISPAVKDQHQKEVCAIEEAMSYNCSNARLITEEQKLIQRECGKK